MDIWQLWTTRFPFNRDGGASGYARVRRHHDRACKGSINNHRPRALPLPLRRAADTIVIPGRQRRGDLTGREHDAPRSRVHASCRAGQLQRSRPAAPAPLVNTMRLLQLPSKARRTSRSRVTTRSFTGAAPRPGAGAVRHGRRTLRRLVLGIRSPGTRRAWTRSERNIFPVCGLEARRHRRRRSRRMAST